MPRERQRLHVIVEIDDQKEPVSSETLADEVSYLLINDSVSSWALEVESAIYASRQSCKNKPKQQNQELEQKKGEIQRKIAELERELVLLDRS